MRTYLQAFDLWEVVNTDIELAPLKANPIVAQICQHADERTKRQRLCPDYDLDTPKQAWDKLKEEVQGTERTRQQQLLNLRRDFENLKMKEEETVKQYSDRIMAVVNSIRLIGEQFDKVRIVEKVLSTLPERYEAKISSLEDSRDLARISLTELINALYAQEQRRASRIEEHQEGAFQAKVKPSSSNAAYKSKKNWRDKSKTDASRKWDRPCRHCKRPGHPEARCWFRPDATCQNCKKKGHIEKVYKEKGRPSQNQPQLKNEEARVAEQSNDSEEHVFAVSCLATKDKVTKGWLLDSGCTNHMSPDATIFRTLHRSCKTKVKIGNGQFIKAEGKGDVLICTSTGDKVITNVLLVPEIDRNLLIIAQLLDKGYFVVFKGQECKITDPNGSSLMTVTMSDKCFEVNWSGDSAHIASTEDTKLWHQRLGHANFRSMAQMASKKMVENFTKSVQGEDVCEIESLNGSKYFILFIDDYTRFCWIFFLKHKLEVAQVFVKFKAAAKAETGYKLKTIRTDNGTEYTSVQFQALCNKAGVKHQLTNVYTPQQNGVSERKNRILLDMARCLLFEKKLPKNLWAEAVNTAVYLQNRLPTKALEQKTPFEVWFGFKPSVEHLRVFGCLCYAHIPAVKRNKLSERDQPGILMGYNAVKKGYRILDPLTNKMQTEGVENGPDMDLDDEPVRGIRTLAKIYERAHMAQVEPSSFEEAKADKGWRQAMAVEITIIEKNQSWKLVDANRKVIGVKWGYKAKQNADGNLNKLKARLVVKAQMHWNVYHLDVKSAFLNGILEEEIYVEQPQGFEVPSKEDMLVVSLHVDDLLVTGGDEAVLTYFKTKMRKMFEMTDLGLMTYFLRMEPTPTPVVVGMKLSSHEGHEEVCETTYRSLISCLLYLTATRPDIIKAEKLKLTGYTDSDWASFKDDMKSTSGYAFTLGSAMVCWSSKKQSLVAQSTTEAKYVAATSAVNQAIWLRKVLVDLNLFQKEATEIFCDNKSAVAIAKNLVFHGKTKHFDIKLHVIREMEQACEIKLVHCNSEDQIADILTKGLGISRFNKLRKLLGVCSMELKEEC
ncbi:hypothetical protein CXB51_024924 [Gossypium anomalum]|uniref:Integrase catalytic domain-containing protein n=1 Tax=Gossypium anomalum TaxID=47600 RepID=A0A8J5Y9J6_9ROSI|nr:hypothetical protein CXB51_024924 [Gossypium anomalum]